jgi:hypothetical protein
LSSQKKNGARSQRWPKMLWGSESLDCWVGRPRRSWEDGAEEMLGREVTCFPDRLHPIFMSQESYPWSQREDFSVSTPQQNGAFLPSVAPLDLVPRIVNPDLL